MSVLLCDEAAPQRQVYTYWSAWVGVNAVRLKAEMAKIKQLRDKVG